jgi:AcrR family transcriptional regulator
MGQPAATAETPVTRPLSRKRRQTQERLLDAALDAFAERGFHGASVEDVCERAGFSRGAFYSNYSSKTELFIALYRRQTEKVLAVLDASAGPAGELDNRDLSTVVTQFLAAAPHDRRWFLINYEFALLAVRNESSRAAFAAARNRAWTIFAAHLTDLLERMGLELTMPALELTRWLFAVYEGGATQAFVEPDQVSPQAISERVNPLILAAVTRPKV